MDAEEQLRVTLFELCKTHGVEAVKEALSDVLDAIKEDTGEMSPDELLDEAE